VAAACAKCDLLRSVNLSLTIRDQADFALIMLNPFFSEQARVGAAVALTLAFTLFDRLAHAFPRFLIEPNTISPHSIHVRPDQRGRRSRSVSFAEGRLAISQTGDPSCVD
jgi:hypothetical protein